MLCRKLLIATDVWVPQVNGVVKNLQHTISELLKKDFEVFILHPEIFPTIPIRYKGIPLSIPMSSKIRKQMQLIDPDYIHIAFHGPIGIQIKRFCDRNNLKYTTAFCTDPQKYFKFTWKLLRWFHSKSHAVLCPSSVIQDLRNNNVARLCGVDSTRQFVDALVRA